MMDSRQELFAGIEAGDRAAIEAAAASDPTVGKATGPLGVSAILHALYHGQQEIAGVLADACEDRLDLHEATAIGNDRRLGELLAAGAQLDARSGDGFTPVHYAAFFGQADCLGILLAEGAPADLPAANPSRVRPLHSALVRPDRYVVWQLLEAGVDPSAKQEGGYTALHSAYLRGAREIVDMLLAAGADPDARADDGRKPAEMVP